MGSAKRPVWRWRGRRRLVISILHLCLCRAGADVMVTDYSEDTHKKCEDLVRQIRDLGRRSMSCVCDVRYPESVKKAVTKCQE